MKNPKLTLEISHHILSTIGVFIKLINNKNVLKINSPEYLSKDTIKEVLDDEEIISPIWVLSANIEEINSIFTLTIIENYEYILSITNKKISYIVYYSEETKESKIYIHDQVNWVEANMLSQGNLLLYIEKLINLPVAWQKPSADLTYSAPIRAFISQVLQDKNEEEF